MIGPSYRADLWAALEAQPNISVADLARQTYSSFATAWDAKRAFALLAKAGKRSQWTRLQPSRTAGLVWVRFIV